MTQAARADTEREPARAARLHYLDYLRAGVVALVFMHHTAITYGALGSWYYSDAGSALLPKGILTIFVAVNQGWFMGFLFFLSGYFSIPSYTRKGAAQYVADRLRRFGIPLVVYVLAIAPAVDWVVLAAHGGPEPSLLTLWSQVDTGPLWFVEALLIMDLLFVAWAAWLSRMDLTARPGGRFPTSGALAAFAVGLGLISFVVRLGMPVGATFANLQIAYFPSYVAMFVLGMVAWRHRWLDAIPDAAFRFGRAAVIICVAFITLGILALLARAAGSTTAAASSVSAAQGGFQWSALEQAIWEQFVLVGMSLVVLRWGQRRLNHPSPRWQAWASASYVAYIIQPLVIVPAAILFQGADWPVLVKFALVAPLAVAATYAAARALRFIRPIRTATG